MVPSKALPLVRWNFLSSALPATSYTHTDFESPPARSKAPSALYANVLKLFPAATFDDFVLKLEDLGNKRHVVEFMRSARLAFEADVEEQAKYAHPASPPTRKHNKCNPFNPVLPAKQVPTL